MSSIRTPLTVSPHEYFGDITGRPLDYGTIYFGEPDKDPEFYPIDVYSDEALTQPIPQPIRTKGGFINVNGDIIEIFGRPAIYSVKVLDQYGRKIFYKGKAMRNNVNDDIIAEIDAAIQQSKDDGVEYAKKAVREAIDDTVTDGSPIADTMIAVDGSLSQRTINKGLESIADLSTIKNPKDGLRIYVKSYYAGLGKGGGHFVYDSTKTDENDKGLVVNGWVRENVSAITPSDFGAIGDGVASDLNALTAFFKGVTKTGYGTGDLGATYLINGLINLETTKSIKIDFKGARIKTNLAMGVNTWLTPLSIKNIGVYRGSKCEINDLFVDFTSQTVRISTDQNDIQGVNGFNADGFETNIFNNYDCEGAYFGCGLKLQRFTTNNLTNINLKDCGVKFNPTKDDTSAKDAAGDALYLANPRGDAKTTITNYFANSQDGYLGRGGIVCEDFDEQYTSHLVIVNNGHLDSYHRGVHQEDGGKSKIIWNGGSINGCAVVLYNIQGKDRDYAVLNNVDIDISTNVMYGGVSGLVNMQMQGYVVLNDCNLKYSAGGTISQRGSFEMNGGSIDYGNTEVVSTSDYRGKQFNKVNIKFSGGKIVTSADAKKTVMTNCKAVSTTDTISIEYAGTKMDFDSCDFENIKISATNIKDKVVNIKNSTLVYSGNITGDILTGYDSVFVIDNSSIVSKKGTLNVYGNGGVRYKVTNSKIQDITFPGINLSSSKDGMFVAKNNEFTVTSAATRNPIVAEYGTFYGIIENNTFYNSANFDITLPKNPTTVSTKGNTVYKSDGTIFNSVDE